MDSNNVALTGKGAELEGGVRGRGRTIIIIIKFLFYLLHKSEEWPIGNQKLLLLIES